MSHQQQLTGVIASGGEDSSATPAFTQKTDGGPHHHSLEAASEAATHPVEDTAGDKAAEDKEKAPGAFFVPQRNAWLIPFGRPELGLYYSMSDRKASARAATKPPPSTSINSKGQRVIKNVKKVLTKNQLRTKPTAPTTTEARDQGRPLHQVSLAATHPAKYVSGPQNDAAVTHSSKSMYAPQNDAAAMPPPRYVYAPQNNVTAMPPPPPKPIPTRKSSFDEYMSQNTSPEASISTPSPLSPTISPADLPWRRHADPMWQTSTDPHFWSRNCMTLRSDTSTEPGNVVSPTFMVGLPCGGMIEMANHYGETPS